MRKSGGSLPGIYNYYQEANSFLSPASLNLLYINDITPQTDLRFGFPHIKHPLTHYQVTPFDGIYNIGNNNGVDVNNNPRPGNQLHVEDPQEFIGDYLSRFEVAPEDLYLSNRTIGSTAPNYIAEFESRNKIIAGKNNFNSPNLPVYTVNNFNHYLTAEDDFIVTNNSRAIMHSGDDIEFHPGFSVDLGSSLDAFIQPFTWSNSLFRTGTPYAGNQNGSNSLNGISENSLAPINAASQKKLATLFPNPSSGVLNITSSDDNLSIGIFDMNGRQVYFENLEKKRTLDLNFLSNGIYLIQLNNLTMEKEMFKWVISK
jgi:hypothetical protein